MILELLKDPVQYTRSGNLPNHLKLIGEIDQLVRQHNPEFTREYSKPMASEIPVASGTDSQYSWDEKKNVPLGHPYIRLADGVYDIRGQESQATVLYDCKAEFADDLEVILEQHLKPSNVVFTKVPL